MERGTTTLPRRGGQFVPAELTTPPDVFFGHVWQADPVGIGGPIKKLGRDGGGLEADRAGYDEHWDDRN